MKWVLLFLVLGCSSLPRGKGVLKKEVKENHFFLKGESSALRERSYYIEVTRYPRMTKEGHIIGEGSEFLNIKGLK